MKRLHLAGIAGGAVCSDRLQCHGMRQAGGRAWELPLAVFSTAISFCSFAQLLRIAPLSFAVAASIAFGPVLDCIVLKEMGEFRRRADAILVAGGVVLLAQ